MQYITWNRTRALLNYLAAHRNKSDNEKPYPSHDTEIVADDRIIPALAYLLVMMAGSCLKSAQKKRLDKQVQTNCHSLTGGLHDKC